LSGSDADPGWLRRLWRNLYWFRADRRIRAEYRGARHLVYFGGNALGDEVLVTTVLRELRRRGGTGLGVLTMRPEVFAHSSDVDLVKPMRHDHTAFFARVGIPSAHLGYIHQQLPPDIDVPPPRHLLAEMCRLAGITGEIQLRPYLYLTDVEKTARRRSRPYVVMHSSCRSAALTIGNKEWFTDRFQLVADALASRYEIVQLGLPSDPPLVGATDLRGHTSLRESAAVLAGAQAFIGLIGLLMHLARAVDCPAVIIYGGRESPAQSGYVCNENLYSAVPCAPCWRWNSCDYERRCMTAIQPIHVLHAFDRLQARPRAPLAIERVILSSSENPAGRW
jgi:hypothetical protein